MNINQVKENLINQGVDLDKIDFESYSKDIPIEDWLRSEYGIELKDNFQLQAQALKEQQAYEKSTALVNKLKISNLFRKPKIIGLCANSNEGKSNTIYWILDKLSKDFKFKVYVYGLRCEFQNTIRINSVEEMEQIKNSIILIDEMFSLFDLDNRKVRSQVENTLRLIFHNNNVLLICGLGENFKKFLSAKLHAVIFKKITLADLINGSTVKNIIMSYKGEERGTAILDLEIDEALVYDGLHYHLIDVPYMKQYDSKIKNIPILVPKNVIKNVNQKRNPEKVLSKTQKGNIKTT